MKDWRNILILVLIIALAVTHYFAGNKKPIVPPEKPVEITVPAGSDTKPKPVPPVIIKIVDSAAVKKLLREVDSLKAVKGDTVFILKHLAPFTAVIEDSLTKNFVTVNPLNPKETKMRIDSTQYKRFTVSGKVEITEEDCKPYIPSWYEHLETKIIVGVLVVIAIAK